MLRNISRVCGLTVWLVCGVACGGETAKPSSAASGDGGAANVRWLSTAGPCDELERVSSDSDAKENLGLVFCGNAGKRFTGELRCARDFIEVQCD